jgi:hypothetical protein
VLHLTGAAQALVGAPAFGMMPRQASITTIETTGYTFIRNALSIRQEPGTDVGRSPYSPKIKYLLEEPEALATTSKGLQGLLTSAVSFHPTLRHSDSKSCLRVHRALKFDLGRQLSSISWIG